MLVVHAGFHILFQGWIMFCDTDVPHFCYFLYYISFFPFTHWGPLRVFPCLGYCEHDKWTWEWRRLFKILISNPSEIYPVEGLLDLAMVQFLTLGGISILFPIVAAPIHFPINYVEGALFSLFLASSAALLSFYFLS